MENVLRYFFFDVLLSAGLPVAAAYIANWAVVNRFRIHDYLGDGQLCFYATTLSVVTTSGLFASKTASLTVKISAGGTMLWVVILANVVWALDHRAHTGSGNVGAEQATHHPRVGCLGWCGDPRWWYLQMVLGRLGLFLVWGGVESVPSGLLPIRN